MTRIVPDERGRNRAIRREKGVGSVVKSDAVGPRWTSGWCPLAAPAFSPQNRSAETFQPSQGARRRRFSLRPRFGQERRPGWVGGKGGGRDRLLDPARHVDHVETSAALPAWIAEEHYVLAVGRPGRPLVMKPFGEKTLARAVRLHDPDGEAAPLALCEGDVIAAWRPGWLRVGAFAERDAVRIGAVGPHHVDLLLSAAIALEHDLAPVRRERRRGIDRVGVRKARGGARAEVHDEDVGVAALLQAHDD